MIKKLKYKITTTAIIALALITGFSCTEDILQETPRSTFTPDFFQTELGVQGGLTYLYQNLRNLYGQPYHFNSLETGTDEYTYAQSADNNFKGADLSGVGQILSDFYPTGIVWSTVFPAINTASGIIENAATVGLDPSIVAEANYHRAFNYFLLVKTYGGAPLDLGAGELVFNTSAISTSVRNSVAEVYTKAIFPDLNTAINDLPDNPRLTGTVTKNVARLTLAKAYLTYAWWLENPNNIPTYPEVARTDPDGQNAAYYFQQAYNISATAIDNPGPYALQEYFYDVHLASNDRHSEMMLYADRTEESQIYNGASLGWSGTGGSANTAAWMVTSNYTSIRVDGVAAVQREAVQSLGRPWTRMAPTINVFEETFADKAIDARYDATFVTSYRGNWDVAGVPDPTITGANGLDIAPGEAVMTFLDDYDATVDYSVNGGNLGGGQIAGRSDYVINPNEINRRFYPGLWKIGTYRTDSEGGLGSPNGAITRPFPIAKFSEFYLVAAEAAVKGATPQGGKSARELVNVLRARAGKWRFDNGEQQERIEDNSAALIAATPATIDIDYILAERSREFFGEGYRWYDLVRTQKWAEVAANYEIAGNDATDHSPVEVTRTIENYHYLRPIPQSQLDQLDMSDAEKETYQNPGY
ncbi:RagB/SusD family nutrient uptake outer membrane protein [Thalassobellus sediminis]|uniref:RagB/SusD family nutrient uptake outer membrane protein n=1 Tax=Thalassobellus sediminis TaxID=3367753 RepID=UPI003792CF08